MAIFLALPVQAQSRPPTPDEMDFDQLIAQGRRLLKMHSFSQGEELFRRALKKKPRSAVAHNELGVAMFQQDAVEVAVASFKEAIKIEPKMQHAWGNLAEAYRRAKNYKEGARAFHYFLGLSKGDPYGLLGLGLCFEGYYQLEKSLKTLQIAAKGAREYRLLLSRVHRAIKRVKFKIKEAKLPILRRVDAMILAGQLEEAMGLLGRGMKSKNQPAFVGRRGLVKAIMGDMNGARTDLESALLGNAKDNVAAGAYVLVLDVLLAGSSPTFDGARAGVLLNEDRPALAYKAFNAALTSGDVKEVYKQGRGESALRMGLFEDAQADLAGTSEQNAAALAELQALQGKNSDAQAGIKKAKLPLTLAELPVWRRSILLK